METIGDAEIHLLFDSKSGRTKVFFNSRQEVQQAGYAFDENDVCARTGRVNRFLGIRGDAKELFLRSQNGEENRIHLHPYTYTFTFSNYIPLSEERDYFLKVASTIVEATGYRPNPLYIYDYSGYIGHWIAGASDSTDIDGQARIRHYTGAGRNDLIPGAYAIGLGRTRLSTETFGGEPNAQGKSIDGVNIYHGPVGETIVKHIRSNNHPTFEQRFDDIC